MSSRKRKTRMSTAEVKEEEFQTKREVRPDPKEFLKSLNQYTHLSLPGLFEPSYGADPFETSETEADKLQWFGHKVRFQDLQILFHELKARALRARQDAYESQKFIGLPNRHSVVCYSNAMFQLLVNNPTITTAFIEAFDEFSEETFKWLQKDTKGAYLPFCTVFYVLVAMVVYWEAVKAPQKKVQRLAIENIGAIIQFIFFGQVINAGWVVDTHINQGKRPLRSDAFKEADLSFKPFDFFSCSFVYRRLFPSCTLEESDSDFKQITKMKYIEDPADILDEERDYAFFKYVCELRKGPQHSERTTKRNASFLYDVFSRTLKARYGDASSIWERLIVYFRTVCPSNASLSLFKRNSIFEPLIATYPISFIDCEKEPDECVFLDETTPFLQIKKGPNNPPQDYRMVIKNEQHADLYVSSNLVGSFNIEFVDYIDVIDTNNNNASHIYKITEKDDTNIQVYYCKSPLIVVSESVSKLFQHRKILQVNVSQRYALVGCIEFINNGHFISWVYQPTKNKWYRIDDQKIEERQDLPKKSMINGFLMYSSSSSSSSV